MYQGKCTACYFSVHPEKKKKWLFICYSDNCVGKNESCRIDRPLSIVLAVSY